MPALDKEWCISTHIKLNRCGKRGERGYSAVYSFLLTSAWHLVETVDCIVSDLALIKKGHYFVWKLDCLRGKMAVVRFSPHTQT